MLMHRNGSHRRGKRPSSPIGRWYWKTDPEVPPLPPHITLDQARKFTSMLVRGDPDEGNALIGTAKEILASVLPGRD
jgi:hypothetical protein